LTSCRTGAIVAIATIIVATNEERPVFTVRVAAELTHEGSAAALARLRIETIEVPQQFPGCERFQLLVDPDHPERVFVYEEWADRSAFERYRTSEYFEQGGAILFPAMASAPDSAYYESERVGP
jgi:quinol monooxygenase YgiN